MHSIVLDYSATPDALFLAYRGTDGKSLEPEVYPRPNGQVTSLAQRIVLPLVRVGPVFWAALLSGSCVLAAWLRCVRVCPGVNAREWQPQDVKHLAGLMQGLGHTARAAEAVMGDIAVMLMN